MHLRISLPWTTLASKNIKTLGKTKFYNHKNKIHLINEKKVIKFKTHQFLLVLLFC